MEVLVGIIKTDHEAPVLVCIVRPHWRIVPSFRKAQDAHQFVEFIAQQRAQRLGEAVDHAKRLAEFHHTFVRRKPFQGKLRECGWIKLLPNKFRRVLVGLGDDALDVQTRSRIAGGKNLLKGWT